MIWYAKVFYDKWDLYAMVWDLNAMVCNLHAMVWYLSAILCYGVCYRIYAWMGCRNKFNKKNYMCYRVHRTNLENWMSVCIDLLL